MALYWRHDAGHDRAATGYAWGDDTAASPRGSRGRISAGLAGMAASEHRQFSLAAGLSRECRSVPRGPGSGRPQPLQPIAFQPEPVWLCDRLSFRAVDVACRRWFLGPRLVSAVAILLSSLLLAIYARGVAAATGWWDLWSSRSPISQAFPIPKCRWLFPTRWGVFCSCCR